MKLQTKRPAVLRERLDPKPLVTPFSDSFLDAGLPLPLPANRPGNADLSSIFEGFAVGMRDLDRAYADLQRFGAAIVAANTSGSKPGTWNLNRPVPQDLANVGTAVRAPTEVYPLIFGELERQRKGLFPATIGVLEQLVSQHLCGLIDWRAADVARYAYFTWSFNEETLSTEAQLSRRNPLVQLVKTVGRRTVVGQMTVHDLILAAPHPLPALDVARPARVDRLIESIPTWLRPAVQLVDGVQIRSETVEIYRQVEKWTRFMERPAPPRPVYHRDPALVIGCYVLAGWDESERA